MSLTSAAAVRLCVTLLVLVISLSSTATAFPFGKSSAVTELTPATINAFVNTHKPVVLLLYAPWCGHCKQFHPELEKFAESVKGTMRVGAIDADKFSNIGQQFGVRGFPTIKYWKSGAKSIASPLDYGGQRTAAALQSLMVGDIGTSQVAKIATADQLKEAARAAPKRMVGVLFSAKDKVPPMVSVMALSPKLKELPLAFAGSCSPQKGVAAAFGVTQLPMLGVVRYTPADGAAAESFELVPYTKKAIAYEPVAQFFLSCTEGECGTGAAVPGSDAVDLDEAEQQAAQAQAAPRQASAALPVAPVAYASTSIPLFCSPQTRKIRGQSPLCVFSLSEHVDLAEVHRSFQNDPLLFFDAVSQRAELAQQLKDAFGVTLAPAGEGAAAAPTNSIVVLRHSKPMTVRYAVLEHINSDDDMQTALQRILNGELHLQSAQVNSA